MPISSTKFQSVGIPLYILVIKHECKLLDGFRYIKELLMQMHNNKMMNAYDNLLNNDINVYSVKPHCFTIKSDDLDKAKKY